MKSVQRRDRVSYGVRKAMRAPLRAGLCLALLGSFACGPGQGSKEDAASSAGEESNKAEIVGYDIRVIRPTKDPLATVFEKLRQQALAENKRVAVLFSADWCGVCQNIETELGNEHPREAIGDVRIVIIKEEDWDGATRMNEFNDLRLQWSDTVLSYPLFLLLDEKGEAQEEMKQAVERFEKEGLKPNLAMWFESTRKGA